ncbi:hypothetical protein [Morganella morganii]|uniref:tail fiber/spike domain-containing protein n=1 Tax=Morganella morganii TaxID=582 RepID=UPI003B9DC8AE
MATIPTQNTVPSEAPRDLKFNSGKIDEFVTSLEHEYKDRFGRCHMTIEGMRWVFEQLMERFKVDVNQAIVAAGYIPMDSFQQGAEITKRNEVLRDETTGEYYRWDGDLPKSVQAGSTPESTGGVGVGKWVGVGDASLRSELKKELVTESVKTDKLEVTGNEITVGGSSVTFPDKDVNITNDNIFIGDVRIGRRPGDIYLSPFPSFELDFGEFEANGAPYRVDSDVGVALKNLSFAYRMAWGIVETNGFINMPNMYDRDGNGLYIRAGQVGDGHSDAQVPVSGSFSIKAFGTSGNSPLIIDREGAFYAESGSGTNTGTLTIPITTTATESKANQRVFINSDRNHAPFTESRTKSRMMTPVIFLGVDNEVIGKKLVVNGSDNIEPWFYAKNAGVQNDNLLQSVLVRHGVVYMLHPYYKDGKETNIVISLNTIQGDRPTQFIFDSNGYHQGLGVAAFNGERYIITSASASSEIGHQSSGIAVYRENSPGAAPKTYRVFDTNTKGMTSPAVSEDGQFMVVVQYNNDVTELKVRVIDLPSLILKNTLVILHEWIRTEDNPSDPTASCAINGNRIFLLTKGGYTTTDEVILSEYQHDGVLIDSHVLNVGKSLADRSHEGKLEPESFFFMNGELYYMPVLGPTGKRVNPVYKIGDLT